MRQQRANERGIKDEKAPVRIARYYCNGTKNSPTWRVFRRHRDASSGACADLAVWHFGTDWISQRRTLLYYWGSLSRNILILHSKCILAADVPSRMWWWLLNPLAAYRVLSSLRRHRLPVQIDCRSRRSLEKERELFHRTRHGGVSFGALSALPLNAEQRHAKELWSSGMPLIM